MKAGSYLLFMCSLLVMPINGVLGPSFLGEISGEVYAYVVFFLFAIQLLVRKSIPFGYYGTGKLIWLFLLFGLISTLINYEDILSAFVKGRTGIGRVGSQFIVLIFHAFASFIIASGIKEKSIEINFIKVRRALLYAFSISVLYSIMIEIPYIIGFTFSENVLNSFNSVIRNEEYIDYIKRLRSLSFEAPSYANFLTICTPFGFSFFLTKKKLVSIIFLMFLLIMVFFTDSRTAIILFLFQLVVFVFLTHIVFKSKQTYQIILFSSLFLFVFGVSDALNNYEVFSFVLGKVTSIGLDDEASFHHVSNLGRWGSQVGAISIFINNWIFGVGTGQLGFHLVGGFPEWSLLSWQVRNWADPSNPLWPPSFSIYTRILAEMGIVNFVVFLMILIRMGITFKKLTVHARTDIEKVAGVTYLLSLLSVIVLFLQFGSFRLYMFWVLIAIEMATQNKLKYNEVK